MEKNDLLKVRREHAWGYFALHANQRIALFGKYIVIFVLFVTSSGFLITRFQDPPKLDEISEIILCIIFLILTFIFFKIDSRNRCLIKLAEDDLVKVENELLFPESARLFCKEKDSACLTLLRHTLCFHIIYSFSSLIAVALVIYSALHLFCV